ncbi:MAG: FecR family protein, partial [Verrucomicrobiota bacterium]
MKPTDTSPNQRLRELVGILCDQGLENLKPAQREELNNILRESPAMRREFAGLMDLHGQLLTLQQWNNTQGTEEKIIAFESAPRERKWLSVATLAAALILGALVINTFINRNSAPSEPDIATLIDQRDAIWEGFTPTEGAPIGTKELTLTGGEATIRTTSGITLHLNQGTTLTLESSHSAFLREGQIYFVNPSSEWVDAPFLIRTPKAKFEHLGTRYSVTVREDGIEELFVEEGAVIRETPSGQQEQIEEQTARRWSQADPLGEEIAFTKGAYYRRAAKRSVKGLPTLRETFSSGKDLEASLTSGSGVGLKGPWMIWHKQQSVTEVPEGNGELSGLNLNDFKQSDHGLSISRKGAIIGRSKIPIDLSTDQVTYFSLSLNLIHESETPGSFGGMYVAFRSPDEADHKIQLSIANERKAGLEIGTQISYFDGDTRGKAIAAMPLSPQETSLTLAGKIVSHAEGPDQIFVRVIPSFENIDSLEPWAWSLTGKEVDCDFSLDR